MKALPDKCDQISAEIWYIMKKYDVLNTDLGLMLVIAAVHTFVIHESKKKSLKNNLEKLNKACLACADDIMKRVYNE